MADASALSLRTIQRVENNGTGSPETIKALASCLEIKLSELFHSESEKTKSYFKAKGTALLSLIVTLGSGLFLTSASIASDISISAKEMEAPLNESIQIYRNNVEIFVPKSVPLTVSTESIWENELASVAEGSVEVKLEDFTVLANKAIIVKMEKGIKITTDYAEQHFHKAE
ncbi:XRE family transcriptional regulator [Thalassotalea euphylliae]|uniref:XRE family transcriptional regulator n=1 Tax=Thalassotalea euphylliae TaxID=1655234 RepID=UPI0021614D43|nr:XRE family transcriptional regulator [Thalassotalea euphylliae]